MCNHRYGMLRHVCVSNVSGVLGEEVEATTPSQAQGRLPKVTSVILMQRCSGIYRFNTGGQAATGIIVGMWMPVTTVPVDTAARKAITKAHNRSINLGKVGLEGERWGFPRASPLLSERARY